MASKESSLHSMTGYGRGSSATSFFRLTIEIRSVNGRFLEIRPKIPRPLYFLEPSIRELVEKKVKRGMIDISLMVQPLNASLSASVDESLALAYADKAKSLAEKLEVPHGLTGLTLIRLPGVISAEDSSLLEKDPSLKESALEALEEALGNFLEMRRREGEKLGKVLHRELSEIREHRDWLHGHRSDLNESYSKRIRSRVKEWLPKSQAMLDESRLYQEVAFYLDRSDVTEELDRLASHLKQFEDALDHPQAKSVGKRLEFLVQELGREVNTIGAKSDNAKVTNHVVEMKLTLEKLREQVQNLE